MLLAVSALRFRAGLSHWPPGRPEVIAKLDAIAVGDHLRVLPGRL